MNAIEKWCQDARKPCSAAESERASLVGRPSRSRGLESAPTAREMVDSDSDEFLASCAGFASGFRTRRVPFESTTPLDFLIRRFGSPNNREMRVESWFES